MAFHPWYLLSIFPLEQQGYHPRSGLLPAVASAASFTAAFRVKRQARPGRDLSVKDDQT